MTKYLAWRIALQVVAMQMREMKNPSYSNDQRSEWKQRILETLVKINKLAQEFNPQAFPQDIPCPVDFYPAQSVQQGNWLESMTQELTHLFCNATPVPTMSLEA